MKNLFHLFILFTVACSYPSRAEQDGIGSHQPVMPRSFAELPRPKKGHWYSREVRQKEGEIVTYDTFHDLDQTGSIIARRSLVLTEPLAASYQPGDLFKALPLPRPGHWYYTQADNGTMRVWDRTYILNSHGQREELSSFLLEEPPLTEPERNTGPSKTLRLQPKGTRPLVGETLEEETPKKTVDPLKNIPVGPEVLVEEVPPALTSIDWSDRQVLTTEEKSQLFELTRQVTSQSKRWQFDLSKRFLTCSEGKCLVQKHGQQVVEVPFQVGLGRVWLLSIEAERLAHDLESASLSSEAVATRGVQLVRRMESLQGHLALSVEGTKSSYGDKLQEQLAQLQKLSDRWNVYETSSRKRWVLRWQLVLQDQAAMQERVLRLEKAQVPVPDSLKKPSERLALLFSGDRQHPWELSREEQKELADAIALETSTIREDYKALTRLADTLRPTPKEYVDLLVVLGAAENLSVYAWTIFTELN